MSTVRVTQVKSSIDRSHRQKDTLKALGLRKINQSVEHTATPQILGMIDRVKHLVTVENL
jgi:large subunit ribosomal protein L30